MKTRLGYITGILALSVLVYVAIRAFNIPFTHDECLSYKSIQYAVGSLLTNDMQENTSANNHVLNSLFMKLSDAVFGNHVFSLRVHSLLALVVYIFYAFRLTRTSVSPHVALFGFVLLLFNPYMLDFFSLARGYAMSWAFMLMSLYHLIRYTQQFRVRDLLLCNLGITLAVLANFALLTFHAAFLLLFAAICIIRMVRGAATWSRTFFHSVAVLPALALSAWIYFVPIHALLQRDQLYFGGQQGFWEDTTKSLIFNFLYTIGFPTPYWTLVSVLEVVTIVVLAAVPVTVLVLFLKNRRTKIDNGLIVGYVLLWTISGITIVQHLAMGGNLLTDRFAVFLYPLFIFVFFCLADQLCSLPAARRFAPVINIFAVAVVVHFMFCANISFAINWRYDADTPRMLSDLAAISGKEGLKRVRLSPYWYLEPAINYYREREKYDWLEPVTRNWPKDEFDYMYLPRPIYTDLKDLNGRLVQEKVLLVSYPESRNVLCRVKFKE